VKYLQLFDHLGNLVKEFEVYVEGNDFEWAAIKPEPVWVGTIRLSAVKAALPVEPTPEPSLPLSVLVEPEHFGEPEPEAELVEPEPELTSEEGAELEAQTPFTTPSSVTEPEAKEKPKPEPEPKIDEKCKSCDIPYGSSVCLSAQSYIAFPNCWMKKEKKVKRELKKRSHKGSRAKGTGSQSGSKRTKTIHQDT